MVVKCKIYGSRNSFLHENIDGVNNPKNNDNNVYDENVNNVYRCEYYTFMLIIFMMKMLITYMYVHFTALLYMNLHET